MSYTKIFSLLLAICLCIAWQASVSFADSPNAPLILDAGVGGCTPQTEICGDGIDQDCDGSDTACPGTDSDRDGFSSSVDCNDNDRLVYPTISVPCSADCGQGTQTCGPNGSFSTCSCAPLCEASGGGRCYYVSKLVGNDSGPGTYQQPFKTFLPFNTYQCPAGASGCAGTKAPPNTVALSAGDVVYFMSGLYDEFIDYEGNEYGMFVRDKLGTSSNRITVKAYPGQRPIFSPAQDALGLYLFNAQHWLVEGIEISGAYQHAVRFSQGNNIEMRNMWIHDTDGVDNGNISGVRTNSTTYLDLHHSVINDNYDRTNADTGGQKTENSRNVVFFDGGHIRLHHNQIYQTPPTTAPKTGGCITFKHGSDVPGSIFEIDHNDFRNCFFHAIGTSTFGGRFHHNVFIDSDNGVMVKNLGGVTELYDNIIEYNTFIRTEALFFMPRITGGSIGDLTFRHNIVAHEESYTPDSGGILTIDTYGPNSIYNQVVPTGILHFSNNCYYNPNNEVKFGLFASNSSGDSSLGGLYNLSGWQGFGYDTNSVVTNPGLDSNFLPATSACQAMGHYAE